jgi:hypothetical protein
MSQSSNYRMPKWKYSSMFCAALYASIPWILVWLFSYAIPTMTWEEITRTLIGPLMMIITPLLVFWTWMMGRMDLWDQLHEPPPEPEVKIPQDKHRYRRNKLRRVK